MHLIKDALNGSPKASSLVEGFPLTRLSMPGQSILNDLIDLFIFTQYTVYNRVNREKEKSLIALWDSNSQPSSLAVRYSHDSLISLDVITIQNYSELATFVQMIGNALCLAAVPPIDVYGTVSGRFTKTMV